MPRIRGHPSPLSSARSYSLRSGAVVSCPRGPTGLSITITGRIGNRDTYAIADSQVEVDLWTEAAGQHPVSILHHYSRRAAWRHLIASADNHNTRRYLTRCLNNAPNTICDRCNIR